MILSDSAIRHRTTVFVLMVMIKKAADVPAMMMMATRTTSRIAPRLGSSADIGLHELSIMRFLGFPRVSRTSAVR